MYSKEALLKRRAELSAAKQALLTQHLRGELPAPAPLATIPKRPAQPLIPLSSIQERFWFLQQLDPSSTHYIGVIVYRMTCLLDLPALAQTAERFVPNPFAGVTGDGCWVTEDPAPNTQHPSPNTRLYKTGDQARYGDDGMLEFLGRVDRQVKIRGFRIELGEIEAALARHAAVQAVAVVERADGLGGTQLVAYVVTGNELQVTSSDEQTTSSLVIHDSSLVTELRTFLMQQLPAYMLPSAIVRLAALPLTPNGKLDQQALPDPGLRAGQALVAPRDTLEMHLVQIWESILARAPIGVSDDFFALGGHSLLAVRLIDAIQRRLGPALPLSTLFQAPTIEQLARLIRQQPSTSTLQPPLVAFRASGTLPPFFCVHPIDSGVFCYAALAQQLGADLPFYGLEAPGLYDEQPPHEDLEELAVRFRVGANQCRADYGA